MLTYGITERVQDYHISCFERIIPDSAGLVRGDCLKMDGWLAARQTAKSRTSLPPKPFKTGFRYEGRVFDIDCYENHKRTTTNRKETEAFSASSISSRVQESQEMDGVYTKDCQSLKSAKKWFIFFRKPIWSFVESMVGNCQRATAHY
jgi:hypothetical protein